MLLHFPLAGGGLRGERFVQSVIVYFTQSMYTVGMQTRTILAACGGVVATFATLILALHQVMGWRMSDALASILLFTLTGGLVVFAVILIGALFHVGGQGVSWAREHIRFQKQFPIRYRPSGEPARAPIISSFTGIDLTGLLPTVLDPFFSINMRVENHTDKLRTIPITGITGLIRCAGQRCNDPPRMLEPLQMQPISYGSGNTCHIIQRVTKEMADNIRQLLSDGDVVRFDLNVQLGGSYLTERDFAVRGPLSVVWDSTDMGDIIRWAPILASQHYYDQLGREKPKND